MQTFSLPLVGRRGLRKLVVLFAPVFEICIENVVDREYLTRKQSTRFAYSGRHSRVHSMFRRSSFSET